MVTTYEQERMYAELQCENVELRAWRDKALVRQLELQAACDLKDRLIQDADCWIKEMKAEIDRLKALAYRYAFHSPTAEDVQEMAAYVHHINERATK